MPTYTDNNGSIVVVGAGPAGQAAASLLPMARVIARPSATAWHAEPGRVWIEDMSGVTAVEFRQLLLCADEPLLLMALGCTFHHGQPVVDDGGATSVTGVYAAGRILGAATAEEAARQGRIVAQAATGRPTEGRVEPRVSPTAPSADAARLDPLDIARLLEMPAGPGRNRAALAQAGVRGGRLADLVAPARPVGIRGAGGAGAVTARAAGAAVGWRDTARRSIGMSTSFDVVVVGGGLHGMSAALHIARRGRRVLVLEKDRVAAHASSYSAGGVRTLGRHPAEVPLAVESLALWHASPLVGDDCGFQETGHVKVAETDAEMEILRAHATSMREAGWDHEELVDAAELRRRCRPSRSMPSAGWWHGATVLRGPIAPPWPSAEPRRPPAPWCVKAPR